jgi:4-hydroxythreonine-4-phosphate dehydrogenase
MDDRPSQVLPSLALTLGDPAGIGPEIILKALADPEIRDQAQITIVGDRQVLEHTYAHLKAKGIQPLVDPALLPIWDCKTGVDPIPGQGNAATGAASFCYLTTAVQQTLAGRFVGVVTAPIAKFAWAAAGHQFPGQTEVLAHFSQSEAVAMAFMARSPWTHWPLRVLLVTTHIPLHQVCTTLTPTLLKTKLDLFITSLEEDFALPHPQVAVAGLNPHSGEGGQLGREEVEWLTPLLQSYPRAQLIGPVPPDTLWVPPAQAWRDANTTTVDGYVALYHDQGLIPVKMLAFDQAVNTTLGLPFVRTSPDHGTAFDIAGRGIARATSLRAALQLAAELGRSRRETASEHPKIEVEME